MPDRLPTGRALAPLAGLTLALAPLALGACTRSTDAPADAPPAAGTAAPATAADTVRVDAAQDGGAVALAPGSVLVVTLDSNPTTGYGWSVVSDGGLSGDSAAVYLPPAADTTGAPVVGRGGQARWTFVAPAAPAPDTLRLAYGRPFEPDAAPARTFTLAIGPR